MDVHDKSSQACGAKGEGGDGTGGKGRVRVRAAPGATALPQRTTLRRLKESSFSGQEKCAMSDSSGEADCEQRQLAG